MPRYAVYVLSRPALALARSLGDELGATVHAPARFAEGGVHGFESLRTLLETSFPRFDGHVFIAAAGIVVRTIGPLLGSKDSDPAVVTMDPEGRFAVSLLSGHLGGANDLARRCAQITGGVPVITTATDSAGVVSMDVLARERGLHMADLGEIKTVNAALLEGRVVRVFDPLGCLGELDPSAFRLVEAAEELRDDQPGVLVHWGADGPRPGLLRLRPPVLTLGVGCRRGTPLEEILDLIHRVLEENGLAPESIVALGTADIKRDEQGILDAARGLNAPLVFFEAGELALVPTPTPSSLVERHVGAASVSEAAALLLSRGGKLLVPKQKTERATLAVARRKTCS